MKFMGQMEYKPEDMDKVIERWEQAQAMRAKEPERLPRVIFGPFSVVGEPRTIIAYEIDNVDQLTALSVWYTPVATFKFVALNESTRSVEIYQKMKSQT